MKPEFIVGYVELVYNPNGHTFWLEGIVDGVFVETHWDINSASCTTGIEDFIKSINPEYWAEMIDSFYSCHKTHYHYNIWW